MTLSQEERIRLAMRRKHLTLWECAKKMGLCPTSLFNRIKGYLQFSAEEILMLERLLEEKLA